MAMTMQQRHLATSVPTCLGWGLNVSAFMPVHAGYCSAANIVSHNWATTVIANVAATKRLPAMRFE